MLRKEKEKASLVGSSGNELVRGSASQPRAESGSSMTSSASVPIGDRKWTVTHQQTAQLQHEDRNRTKVLGSLSMGRQQAFEVFRQDYEHGSAIEANKLTYKQLCLEAKQLGEQLAQSKATINKLKSSIKQHQASLAVSGNLDLENRQPTDVELNMMRKVEEENVRYKETFNRLRILKHEIEHMQHLLEMAKVKLMKDFEAWWTEQCSTSQGQLDNSAVQSGDAWRTPPSTASTLPAVPGSITDSRLGHEVRPPSSGSSSRRQSTTSSLGRPSGHISSAAQPQLDSSTRSAQLSSKIPLTGDAEADADIMAFLQARQNIVRQAANRKPLL